MILHTLEVILLAVVSIVALCVGCAIALAVAWL
jgi:hypothetical protein